ncbi:hypothetical protein F5884DRAFT_739212 [Xylogone sp. PMI_703]|nr:hypothetical protein F5884DRAFT_739212 [Xylogone sp. PMI_703]
MAVVQEALDIGESPDSHAKPRRVENGPLSPACGSELEDDAEDADFQLKEDVFSQAGDAHSYTPATPFSPAPRKFPSEMKTIKCTWEGCTKMFNRPARLASHLRSHTNQRPYVCEEPGCNKSYLEEKHLKQHVKGSHTHERAYQCDWENCGKAFLTATRLRRHREAHEGHNRFRCTAYPPCNQAFRKHQTLQRHIRSEHLQLAPFPCTFVDPVTSEPCKAGFDGPTGLRKHEVQVHGSLQFWCEQCATELDSDGLPVKSGFTTKALLDSHIRKSHFTCLFCPFKCSSRKELSKHAETTHPVSTPEAKKTSVKCSYAGCNKTFSKIFNLNVHVRTTHGGERYICGTFDLGNIDDLATWDRTQGCGKDLMTKSNLADHVRTKHLGLPSVTNTNRKRRCQDSENDGEGEKTGPPKLAKNKKPKVSVVDELLGDAYSRDERRTLRCTVPDCPHMFIRVYDLHTHLRTKHQLIDPTTDAPIDSGISDNNDSSLDQLQDQEGLDLDWGMQNSEQFWIGADDSHHVQQSDDQWLQDELEMRGLIDPDLQDIEQRVQYPDPEFLGL